MPLTRHFKETIEPRVERVSAFGEGLLGCSETVIT